MRRIGLSIVAFALLSILVSTPVAKAAAVVAAALGDVANSYILADNEAQTGDIIVNDNNGFVRAASEYDQRLFGVVADQATIIFKSAEAAARPVARVGTALVNVTTANGQIKKGNYITSSKVPGKGQKATVSGQVVGTALADFDGKEAGQIPVALKIEYAEISNAQSLGRLASYTATGFAQNLRDPGQFQKVLRYILAALVVLLSVIFSFLTFSKSVPKAIEAVGRNPSAKISIMTSLGFSIGLIVLTVGLGIFAAVVILRI